MLIMNNLFIGVHCILLNSVALLYYIIFKIIGNEVIMQPGDMMYLPTYWIHYIISLNVNFQCNTRSGRTSHFDKDIHDCGF